MGRLDPDLMYDIVMDWDWGNSESPDIYHDPETRKNSISYRGNLARLTEELLNQGDKQRAKEILDLAMEKMPFGYFGYYVFLEPYVQGYYQVDERDKARELYKGIVKKYQESLNYYSHLPVEEQYQYASEIVSDVQRYRSLLDIVVRYDTKDFGMPETQTFNEYLERFSNLYGGARPTQPTEQELQDQQPIRDAAPEIPVDSAIMELDTAFQ